MSKETGIDRRQFLGAGAGAFLMAMLGADDARAQEAAPAAAAPTPDSPPTVSGILPVWDGPAVNCAVIGLGVQGRALMDAIAKDPKAPIVAVCDTYEGAHRRALQTATKAQAFTDYRQVLDRNDVDAVFIATPTHQHKQIAVDAIAAGKHVFCEAPMAHTVEDARAIARAGRDSKKRFHVNLAMRLLPISGHALKFVETGALSDMAQVRAQWHKKNSWRRAAGTPARERALNWRLSKATSTGLMGEIGIHQLDMASLYLDALPISVSGFGGITAWDDGRDVADTVQCIIQYPDNVTMVYDATLANSYDGAYQVFMGKDAAIVLRDGMGWWVKEADATALGWEVYARKERVGDETGITLVVGSTKQLELGKKPSAQKPLPVSDEGGTQNSVNHFLMFIRDEEAEADTEAGALEGYQATVAAIKANEAVVSGSKVTFQKEWFDL